MKVKTCSALFGVVGLFGVLAGCTAESTSEEAALMSDSDQGVKESARTETVTREALVLEDGTEAVRVVSERVDALETDALEDNALGADAPEAAEAVAAAGASFWRTCRPFKYYIEQGSAILEAYSDSCQRRNGSWGGPTFWSGVCYSDVANCNGSLRCGRC